MTITRLEFRRGTAAAWTSANPVLTSGEPGYETDTGKFKIGDGATAWASLTYFTSGSMPLSGGTFTGRIAEAVVALTDAATITTDASLGNIFTVTLGGNRTIANPTNPVSGQKIVYRLKQDGTGSRTVTWGAAFRWGADVTVPTLSTTAGKTDYVGFIYNAADSKWDGLAVSRGYT